MDNSEKYSQLREQYPVFSYDSYNIYEKDNRIAFSFRFTQSDEISLNPEWETPFPYTLYSESAEKDFLDLLIFNIGMVELISYWKACCSPKVLIKCGSLSEGQRIWWKKLYFNGQGEFFYTNSVNADISSFMDINAPEPTAAPAVPQKSLSGCLVPVGGGKDSAVTLELLREKREDCAPFMINPIKAAKECVSVAGYKNEAVVLTRRLDKKLLELNAQGYLNGHTPFSALVAFSSLFSAYLTGKKYVVLSNESSANEAYVKDTNVNHQYSKSVEFESDFRSYVADFLPCGVEYFSLLRPWNEWRIVRQFISYEKYFKIFRSCNAGSKSGVWCCNCSKCLYVYIMLSAFLTQKRVEGIFGENLLEREDLLRYFDGLVTDSYDKPFECVGTREEINAAMSSVVEDCLEQGTAMPALVEHYFQKYYVPSDYSSVDNYYDADNFVPPEFLPLLGRGEHK